MKTQSTRGTEIPVGPNSLPTVPSSLMEDSSLKNHVKFNLDRILSTEQSIVKLIGWCGANKKFADIKGIRVKVRNSEQPYVNAEYGFPRRDVESALQNLHYFNTGFEAKISLEDAKGLISIEALVNGEWRTIIFYKNILDQARGSEKRKGKVAPVGPLGAKGEPGVKEEPFFTKINFNFSKQQDFRTIVVDNFYENPDEVREFALNLEYEGGSEWYKGFRTKKRYQTEGLDKRFEEIIGKKITNWKHYMNGVFSWCNSETPVVYHCDTQTYAGAVYLSPDAPPNSGTTFWRSKKHPKVRTSPSKKLQGEVFGTGFFDQHQFELVDQIGNVYNRLVIWDAKLIHSATSYFGNKKENSRLFHLFFFDAE